MSFEKPVRLPLLSKLSQRQNTFLSDARMVNCIAETDENTQQWNIRKRFGFVTSQTLSGAGMGATTWNGSIYAIYGGNLFQNGVQIETGLNAGNGAYRFQIVPGYLVMGNGLAAYYYTGSVFNQITGGSFPATFVKGWSYLDSYLYVMDSLGQIWQSTNQFDPTVWTATDMLRAQIEPDGGVALSKQINYVIALKQWSTEIFYDAGNAAGSSLGPVEGQKQPFGCATADSVQQANDILIWMSNDQNSTYQVVLMQGLVCKVVSTPSVERLLQGANTNLCMSLMLKHAGHLIYVLTLTGANLSLAYDITFDLWYVWTDSNGNYFPMIGAANLAGQRFLQHATNGKFYLWDMDYIYPNDDGVLSPVDIYTSNFDAEVDRKKAFSGLTIQADKQAGSIVQVRSTDDDYQTWTDFKSVDLSKSRATLVGGQGSAYKRAWHFHHKANTPLRIRSTDNQMAEGSG